jgi:hypothetical protein
MFSLAHVIANYVIVLQLDDGLPTRLCVPCGSRSKLSYSQIENLTLTHFGDKSTCSLASQDVDEQEATSNDGKHIYTA